MQPPVQAASLQPKKKLLNILQRNLVVGLLLQAIIVLLGVALITNQRGGNLGLAIIIAAALELLVCATILWLFRRLFRSKLTLPLHAMREDALTLAAGSLGHRFAPQPVDELNDLVTGLNDMAGSLQQRMENLAYKANVLEDTQQFLEAQMLEQSVEIRQFNDDISSIDSPGKTKAFIAGGQDELTGLVNRTQFMLELSRVLDELAPLGEKVENKLVGLLFIDLDQFKVVNDSLGHVVGDELLVAIARRMEDFINGSHLICRFGGDEFVILMSAIQNVQEAETLAKNILDWLAQPFQLQEQEIYTSASIGIAITLPGEKDPVSLLRDADTAVYRAKANGRNRYEVFSERMHLRARRLLKLEAQIRQAIAHDELRMYYQPILRSSDRKIAGLEALIRWKHPNQGFLLPQDFIPLAEEASLIKIIDNWVIEAVCKQASLWKLENYEIPVAVNVSGPTIMDKDTPKFFKTMLDKYDLTALAVDVEISEEAAMQHFSTSLQTITELDQLGIACWMDDFGQAYSSLSHLRYLPLKVIKIPTLFIRNAEENRAILKAVIDMSHALNLRVCAEGIETEQQASLLTELQCDLLQGYLFAPPLPLSGIEELLKAH